MECKNCHTIYDDSLNYCPNCGAKHIRNRLKPSVLMAQVNEQFLSLDNKVLKTFITLFTNPNEVIVGYIEGTRKKYIDVLQYYAIALTITGFQVFLLLTFFRESLEFEWEFLKKIAEAPGNENNPFLNTDLAEQSQYQGLIYTMTLPLSALATWLAYFLVGSRQYNFTEHVVINLYYSSQIIIITAILTIVFLLLGLKYLFISALLFIPTLIYQIYILKRTFKDSFVETFGKYVIVIFITLGGYIIATMAFAIIGILGNKVF